MAGTVDEVTDNNFQAEVLESEEVPSALLDVPPQGGGEAACRVSGSHQLMV